jgi:hypothetical protein
MRLISDFRLLTSDLGRFLESYRILSAPHMFSIMALANSLDFSLVAPCISRSRS